MNWKNILKSSSKPWEITFICSGNIMRSPYAEYIARKILNEINDQQSKKFDLVFKSGAVTYQNNSIHPFTEKFLMDNGIPIIEIKKHKPRLVDNNPEYFQDSTLFITMTNEQKRILNKKGYSNNFLLSEVANNEQTEILDPYFFPEKKEEIYNSIKDYTKHFINELVKL